MAKTITVLALIMVVGLTFVFTFPPSAKKTKSKMVTSHHVTIEKVQKKEARFKKTVPNKYGKLFFTKEYKNSSVGVLNFHETKWSTKNQKVLDDFFKKHGDKHWNVPHNVAVFDCDKTIINADITEGGKKGDRQVDGMLKWLIKNKKLKNVDYSTDIFKYYEELCSIDEEKGYKYPAAVLKGLKQSDVIKWASDMWKNEYQDLIFPESKAIIRRLIENGFEVYIVSASPDEFVKPISRYIGIPAENIYGIRQEVKNGILTGEVLKPMPFGHGKVSVITDYFKVNPILVMGDSITNDVEMLKLAVKNNGLAIFVNPKNDSYEKRAKNLGFVIQKSPFWNEYIRYYKKCEK